MVDLVFSNVQEKYKEKKLKMFLRHQSWVAGRIIVSLMEVKVQQEKLIDRRTMISSVSVTLRGWTEIHMEISSRKWDRFSKERATGKKRAARGWKGVRPPREKIRS